MDRRRIPVVIFDASREGISESESEVPLVTSPLESYVILVLVAGVMLPLAVTLVVSEG